MGRWPTGSTALTASPSPRMCMITISVPSTPASWPSSPRARGVAPSSSSPWNRRAGSNPTTPRSAVTRAMCWTSSGTPSSTTSLPRAQRTRRRRNWIPGSEVARIKWGFKVRIWEIPEGGLKRNMTEALLELHGHSRRVGLVEWHPTTNNILFSAGYDYKVLIWNLDVGEPVKMIDCHSDVILCMSFNTDGSLLTTTCKDKKLRVIEPRSGRVLQEANCKNHRVNRVVFLGNMKRLLTTGVSRWNTRQIALWDQEDLSMPLIEEEIDGLSGLLFPFYDADTHMLYLAGKGDGNIRYYEISTEKPYLSYLMEFRSPAPQKGLGVMPKHGLDVSACEVFRFYKLVTLKGLIEPISMIVPRRSDSYQEDIYPMTPGTEPALTPDEWLGGINRDPVLMSLKEGYKKSPKMVFKAPIKEKKSVVVNGIDLLENVPPRTENELLRMFFRQQDEIRRLKEELAQKDIRIRQLQLELKNLRNSPKNC
uniref:Coronin n=1 Tax=Bos taurus TaxID=9913 RepID=A0ABI0P2C9_BOVIN